MKSFRIFLFLVSLFVVFSERQASAFVLMGDRTELFEKYTYNSDTGNTSFDYYLLKPENYNPKLSYPLVLNLHGASGHSWGAYILSEPSMRKAYPAFVLVPYAPMIAGWQVPVYDDEFPEPIVHIFNVITKIKTDFSIDPKRVYITGYSMGGYGTFGMVAKYPELFAAAAPLCGGGEIRDAYKMIKTPLFIAHGALDKSIPVAQSRRMAEAISKAGGEKVLYAEYPNVGHSVWNEVYANNRFWQWFFAQKRP